MSKVKRLNRSSKTGKFVDAEEARSNPDTTVCETVSPLADMLRDLKEMLAVCDLPQEWRDKFENHFKRIGE